MSTSSDNPERAHRATPMTSGRLAAIIGIFVCASIAWAILAASVYTRTDSSRSDLRGAVENLWGTPHIQKEPFVSAGLLKKEKEEKEKSKKGDKKEDGQDIDFLAFVDSSDIKVDLEKQFRRKGLLWYRTYDVSFDATYQVRHDRDKKAAVTVRLDFPSTSGTYDDFEFSVGGKRIDNISGYEGGVSGTVEVEPGTSIPVRVHYKSRGMDTWSYSFGDGVASVKNFKLAATTDFDRYNFPQGCISPNRTGSDGGRELVWEFKSTVLGQRIGVEMPDVLDPGPFAARVAAFAPVGLLFFCAVLVIVGLMKERNLHPVHYFFVAGGFFAFHLLLAYTADHVDVHMAFLISAVVSVLLVVSYLIRAVGGRFTMLVAAPAQFLFLVLFSYAFFFRGYTGLTITIGSIITLAILMHVTAGVDWDAKFSASRPPGLASVSKLPGSTAEPETNPTNTEIT